MKNNKNKHKKGFPSSKKGRETRGATFIRLHFSKRTHLYRSRLRYIVSFIGETFRHNLLNFSMDAQKPIQRFHHTDSHQPSAL